MPHGYLHERLAIVAAEVEEQHERETSELRMRLQHVESERIQLQLSNLKLEAELRDGNSQQAELKFLLRESREENERLTRAHDDTLEEKVVSTAQLSRINDLSRELIATRFALDSMAAPVAPGPHSAACLGLGALLHAASNLDLMAADAILNPTCILTTPSSRAAAGSSGEPADVLVSPPATSFAPSSAAADPSDGRAGHSDGVPERSSGQQRRDGSRSAAPAGAFPPPPPSIPAAPPLNESLNRALLLVCSPPASLVVSTLPSPPARPPHIASVSPPSGERLSPNGVSPRGGRRGASAATGPATSGRSPRAKPEPQPLRQGPVDAASPSAAAASPTAVPAAAPSAATFGSGVLAGRPREGRAATAAGAEGREEGNAAPTAATGSSAEGPAAADQATAGHAAGQAAGQGKSAATRGDDDPRSEQRSTEAAGALIEALLLRGASVDARDDEGRTALHLSCEQGRVMMAALLIQHGASVDALDNAGRTPLHSAAACGCARLTELLLRHGADESRAGADGQTASQLAASASDHGASATLADGTLRLTGIARRASTMYRHGKFGEAADAFLGAIALAEKGGTSVCSASDRATLHFNCARAAIKEGRHLLALEQANAALAAKPEYANACMLQAECHMELLDFSAAAAAYRRVAEMEPHNASWTDCAERAAKMGAASAYEVLGVTESAEPIEIKKAYKAQCLQWHPDKHQGSAEDRRRANTMFQRITTAFETLSHEHSRNELDIRLRAEALRAEAMRNYRQRSEHEATARGGYRYGPPSVDSILEDAVREANADGFVDNGYGEYIFVGDSDHGGYGGADGKRGYGGDAGGGNYGSDGSGGYGGGYDGSGGYGGGYDASGEDLRFRWPARSSPWFEHDVELS